MTSVEITAAAAALGAAGDIVSVCLAGEHVYAVLRVDEAEHQRRRAAGVGAVTDRLVLEAMAGLPRACPVSLDDLDPLTRSALALAPDGLVSYAADTVTRTWTPAVRLTAVLAQRSSIRSAIAAAAWFAPDTRRAVWAPDVSTFGGDVIEGARAMGVGLVAGATGAAVVWLQPAEPRVVLGPRHWRILEVAYDELLRLSPALPRTSSTPVLRRAGA